MYVHDHVKKHVYTEHAMLVDSKAHTGTRSSTLHTVTHKFMQVNITVIAVFMFLTYVKLTHIHTIN